MWRRQSGDCDAHGNQEFVVLISRLSDIENQGTIPSIYRVYSLCCIYRLDLNDVAAVDGVPVESIPADASGCRSKKRMASTQSRRRHDGDDSAGAGSGDRSETDIFRQRTGAAMGKLPLALLSGVDVSRFRYGFVGTEDWSMYPYVPPGSLLVVDDSKRRIQSAGWRS